MIQTFKCALCSFGENILIDRSEESFLFSYGKNKNFSVFVVLPR